MSPIFVSEKLSSDFENLYVDRLLNIFDPTEEEAIIMQRNQLYNMTNNVASIY